MMIQPKTSLQLAAAFVLAGTLSFAPPTLRAQVDSHSALSDPADPQIQADASKAFDKKQFHDVQFAVSKGILTLTGSVPLFSDKVEADKRAHHIRNVGAVDDRIQVAGPQVEDTTLAEKLNRKVNFDIDYGPVVFNAFTISAQNGVVTIGGESDSPATKSTALGIVESYPGVKGVIDAVKVAPLSGMDNQTRVAEYRAIYGYPTLNKYGMDPNKPIRILVDNGHVTLVGQVDTQADKDTANIRANSVPGVFGVVNNLQVAESNRASK